MHVAVVQAEAPEEQDRQDERQGHGPPVAQQAADLQAHDRRAEAAQLGRLALQGGDKGGLSGHSAAWLPPEGPAAPSPVKAMRRCPVPRMRGRGQAARCGLVASSRSTASCRPAPRSRSGGLPSVVRRRSTRWTSMRRSGAADVPAVRLVRSPPRRPHHRRKPSRAQRLITN